MRGGAHHTCCRQTAAGASDGSLSITALTARDEPPGQDEAEHEGQASPRQRFPGFLFARDTETGKQSKNTLLDISERYIEGYMTLFDTI